MFGSSFSFPKRKKGGFSGPYATISWIQTSFLTHRQTRLKLPYFPSIYVVTTVEQLELGSSTLTEGNHNSYQGTCVFVGFIN